MVWVLVIRVVALGFVAALITSYVLGFPVVGAVLAGGVIVLLAASLVVEWRATH